MTSSFNRRSLVKGAAWATPAVLATATIPAYAASCTGGQSVCGGATNCFFPEYTGALANDGNCAENGTCATAGDPSEIIPQGNPINFPAGCTPQGVTAGLFATVRGEQLGDPNDPIYIDAAGSLGQRYPDRNWSDSMNKITGGVQVQNQNGVPTPYGQSGAYPEFAPGQYIPHTRRTYGATGLWFSSPVTATGKNTGDYFTDYKGIPGGSTTLARGARFILSVKIEYANADLQQKKTPYMGLETNPATHWHDGLTNRIDPLEGRQGSRVAKNGVTSNCTFGPWNMSQAGGKYISSGTITIETQDSLTVETAGNGAPQFQQVHLVPPLKVNAIYGSEILAVSVSISPVSYNLSSVANGKAITDIQDLKAAEAHFVGPVWRNQ